MDTISVAALSGLASLIGAMFPAIALVAIAFRTRFSHTFLMHRLWQIVFSPREIEDPVVKQHIEEETVVASFRTRYNIPIDLPTQAHKLIHWAKAHDVSMPAIGACGSYFDFKLCEIRKKLPSQRRVSALAIFVVFLGGCALMLLALGTNNSVLAQFKESKRHFLVNRDAATPLFPRGPTITRGTCVNTKSAEAAPESFSIADREILCKTFFEDQEIKETATFLKEGLRAQRLLLGGLLLVTLVAATIFFWTVQELRATYRLRKALGERPSAPRHDQSEAPSTANPGSPHRSRPVETGIAPAALLNAPRQSSRTRPYRRRQRSRAKLQEA